MDMRIKGFVIHLRRAAARRENAEAIVASMPFACEIFEAVDAQAMSDDELASSFVAGLHKPGYPFQLTRGEIAAFLSHRAVWSRIVEEGLDAALIVEDDVAFDPSFPKALELARKELGPADYIRFAKNLREAPRGAVIRDGDISLFSPEVTGLGMLAQLVTRHAAEKLLAASTTFDRPVDSFLQMTWLTGINMRCVQPVLVRDISSQLGGTTVQTKRKTLADRVWREAMRTVYRARIRMRATGRQGN